METSFLIPVSVVDVHQLAAVIRNRIENVLIIDSRSFIEHNACHITTAVNICCSKIVKRRLQQDKLSVKELLMHTCNCDVDDKSDVVVYDQTSLNAESLPMDSFTVILLKKLQLTFRNVNLLSGGFNIFQENYPDLCEDKTRKCPPLTSLSQPCLPIANQGPTRILPFLYLGSQFDALNKELLKDHNITYELNVSSTCPQPEFVQEGHFMRIPVNDNYAEKLLPYFPAAFNFLDKVREGSGCVLVHCLAGISRSPTVAIAYIMRYLRLTSDDGYRYVKSKRPTISPNFNFLGQLLEYEKQLRKESILDAKPEATSAPPLCSKKRLCRTDMRTTKLSLDINTKVKENTNIFLQPKSGDQSPTTALAKLSFGAKNTPEEIEGTSCLSWSDFRQYRSKSCYGDWLCDREDSMTEQKSRENSVATASKILSPVKEIKCDALISEISVGPSEVNFKSTGTIKEKRSSYSFSHFFPEKSTVCLPESVEKFSLQTLSHISSKSSMSLNSEKPKTKYQQQTTRLRSNAFQFSSFQESSSESHTSKSTIPTIKTNISETGNKRLCHSSLDRDVEMTLKNRQGEPYFVFSKHSTHQYKPMSTLHPCSSGIEIERHSDSAGTSGFGSESSDCADYVSDVSLSAKKAEMSKLEIDIEDLEDDVILRNKIVSTQSDRRNKDCADFSLILPEVTTNVWHPELESPLSPSESHLFEDLASDNKMSNRTESTSPVCLDQKSQDLDDSFHDSGVPLSPSLLWPRKRVATFDNQTIIKDMTSRRDKRRYEPFLENFPKSRELWFVNIHRKQKEDSLNYPLTSTYQIKETNPDKIGLYRVQSCPGMLGELAVTPTLELHYSESSSGTIFPFETEGNNSNRDAHCQKFNSGKTGFTKDNLYHESCPDVLHLGETERIHDMLPNRHKDFRRNVRMIAVS